MNTERILKLADFIAQLPPSALDMETWLETNGCGTRGCIAGWAVDRFHPNPDTVMHFFKEGQALLELNYKQAKDLFYGPPAECLCNLYFDPSTSQVAAVLRHLAATGEVQWISRIPMTMRNAVE